MSAKDLSPIEALLAVLIDLVKDGIAVHESGQSILSELSVFKNLISDAPAAFSAIHSLPGSLSGFSEPDAASLIQFCLDRGITSDAHAQAVINSALQVGNALYGLIVTIKAPAAPSAPAAAASSEPAAPSSGTPPAEPAAQPEAAPSSAAPTEQAAAPAPSAEPASSGSGSGA